ncbi:disease resistance protein RPS4B-like [Humulus lupulus]|uniref:disease resistance protein RPS4B-like n=1 Tax=Humulus lupulus TaxID=3486 RepID=UPI002B406C48|nr:disease resistance protein RPS4B-like [Humulus lupulus]
MKELNLGGCVCINMFPKLPRNIVRVDLSGTAIEQVPSSSFDYCTSLEALCLKDCTRLEYVSTAISKLKLLNHLDLSYCSKLKCFPNITEPMEHLVHPYLDGSGIEEIQYRSIKTLIGLRMLNLRQCKNLKSLPIGIFCTSHLEVLYLPERLELESSTFQRFEYEYYRDAYNTAKNSILNQQETAYSKEGSILFGDKIPFWFTQQSEGSSIGFKFSSNLLEIDSITLALCMVVNFEELYIHETSHIIRCECHFIKCDNTIRKRVFVFPKQEKVICYKNSNFLLMWYLNETFSNIHDTVEVSFDFSIVNVEGKQHRVGLVKKCGIHVLNSQCANSEKIPHNYFPLLLYISEVIHKLPSLTLLHL